VPATATLRRSSAGAASALFAGTALLAAAAGLFFTWRRLFVGMDLQAESHYVVIPWRWALGDRPFVHEENLAQLPGLLTYPFVKAFAALRHGDPTGLILFTRHLYLLLMLAVAAGVFLLLRRLMRGELALISAGVFVTFIFWATPQLSYDTMGAAFLTLGGVLGAFTVLGMGGRAPALGSGVACGLAVVAYPTLLFVMPFYGVALVFALGRRAPGMIVRGALRSAPDSGAPATGRAAWEALSAWSLGGAAVLLPVAALLLSFGRSSLLHSWHFTMAEAARLDQLGGAAKAAEVTQGLWRFFASRPYAFVGAVAVYLVFRRSPVWGRRLLVLLPVALFLAGRHPPLAAAGFVLVYAVLAPYLYLFLPAQRREAGAALLVWIWVPSLLAGAMAAYTSAAGSVHAPVGMLPALVPSSLFLVWALGDGDDAPSGAGAGTGGEAAGSAARRPWLTLATVIAVVAVTVGLQFQYQQGGRPYGELRERLGSGPWLGISVTAEDRGRLQRFAGALRAQARPGDALLVYPQAPGYYLFWSGAVAANSYWLTAAGPGAPLPESTYSYFRRRRVVPSLVVHVLDTRGRTAAELQACTAGFGYPAVAVDAGFAIHRRPADETVADVLARLPRE